MNDENRIDPKVRSMMERGVVIPRPESLEVDSAFDPARVAPGVVIHAGCRLWGRETSIGPGSILGEEAPVTLDNCRLGHRVLLKGGFCSGSVFLNDANLGSAAQIRPGTLLEEEANGAHGVGLKQTILLSYVTCGSLINFCDLLMAGGTSRKNHSEVGSSYIHFNYTPHQDKATASLLGDVPRGVLLDQAPVFLGGQGGLVGPARIGFGCVIPAGIVFRGDSPGDGYLLYPEEKAGRTKPHHSGLYRDIRRIVESQLEYLGDILALKAWYQDVRRRFMRADPWTQACHEGALEVLDLVRAERIKRLGELSSKMKTSLEVAKSLGQDTAQEPFQSQQKLLTQWNDVEAALKSLEEGAGFVLEERQRFLEAWEKLEGRDYLSTLARLSTGQRKDATAWLQAWVRKTKSILVL